MKLSKILFAACAMLAINASAGINMSKYLGAVVPKHEAKAVLEKVFMHDLSVLDKVDVEVADMQERKNGVKVVFFYVGRMSTQMNTELYAMSFDSGWNVIDGMMLGYSGDAQVLKLDLPEGYYYETQPDIPYSIVSDTLTVERFYRYGTSKLGSKYFNQLGTITSAYLISLDGKFMQLPVTSKATESRGDVTTGEDPVSGEVEGLFNKDGMQILQMTHRPLSSPINMKELNELAKINKEITDSYDGQEPVLNAETLGVIEFSRWSTALGLRDAETYLTWIAKNKGKEALSGFVSAAAHEGEFGEASWLKSKIPALKDKKARQWWQKWLVEQGL